MTLQRSPNFLLIGLGSIGKSHLSHILSYSGGVSVIDPNSEVFKYLQVQNLTSRVEYFSNFENYKPSESPEIGIVANWGPDHFAAIKDLIKLGVKKLLIEKPLVSKLEDLYELKDLVSDNDVKIITNMPLSQGPLANTVHGLQLNKNLGDVQTILVSGGAKCLVTNGIHYIGLASKIFQSFPVNVFSSIENHPINPRSKDFVFAEGNSNWNYGNGKNLLISFSNNSHVQLAIEIIFQFGKMVIEEDSATVFCISEADREKIDKPVRTFYAREILETFEPYHFSNGLDGLGNLYAQIYSSDDGCWKDFEHGFKATEAVIGMLISSETFSKVDLPLVPKVKEKYLSREWNIS
jgi:predicted dehydrogenase